VEREFGEENDVAGDGRHEGHCSAGLIEETTALGFHVPPHRAVLQPATEILRIAVPWIRLIPAHPYVGSGDRRQEVDDRPTRDEMLNRLIFFEDVA
jgi:hypothetical protein